jgi:hypothetical protein
MPNKKRLSPPMSDRKSNTSIILPLREYYASRRHLLCSPGLVDAALIL